MNVFFFNNTIPLEVRFLSEVFLFSTVSSVQSLLLPIVADQQPQFQRLLLCSYCSEEFVCVSRSFDATQARIFMNPSFPGRTNKTVVVD